MNERDHFPGQFPTVFATKHTKREVRGDCRAPSFFFCAFSCFSWPLLPLPWFLDCHKKHKKAQKCSEMQAPALAHWADLPPRAELLLLLRDLRVFVVINRLWLRPCRAKTRRRKCAVTVARLLSQQFKHPVDPVHPVKNCVSLTGRPKVIGSSRSSFRRGALA
jgi:hypothetical protein